MLPELLSIENDAIKPSIEMGAFEALWAKGEVSSYKQLREKLDSSHAAFLSDLVDTTVAKQFYAKIVQRLHETGINHFGVRLAGTIDFPESLQDADYPLALLYYLGNWDLVFSRGVSVVGTRHPSSKGIKRTIKLVKGLVGARCLQELLWHGIECSLYLDDKAAMCSNTRIHPQQRVTCPDHKNSI